MTDVFISHCPKDKFIAEYMCRYLTERGFLCMTSEGYTSRTKVDKGSHTEAFAEMKVFIFIYSDNSSSSEKMAGQLEMALNKPGTTILPYRVNNAIIKERYAGIFAGMVRIDGYPIHHDLRFNQVYEAVSQIINTPAPNINMTRVPCETPVNSKGRIFGYIALGIACAALLAKGLLAVSFTHNVQVKVQEEPETNEVRKIPRETSSFNYTACFLGEQYSGEYVGETGENGLPDGSGEFRAKSSDEAESVTFEYIGEFSDGAITGNGSCHYVYPDDTSYEYTGCFENGAMKGRGVCDYYYPDSDYLIRETHEGLWQDSGNISDFHETEYLANGTVREFSGEFKDNQWSGSGSLKNSYSSGEIKDEVYTGTWVNNCLEGDISLVINYTNGDVCEYSGGFSGEKWNGSGVKTYTYASGDKKETKFEGCWTDGQISGKIIRTVTYTNGDVDEYTGEYSDGNLNGKGIQVRSYASGEVEKSIFEGEWKDGQRTGEGVHTRYFRVSRSSDMETKVLEGVWTEGALSGNVTVTETYADGDTRLYKGGYADNNWHGKGELVCTYVSSSDGKEKKVIKGTWDNGKLTGNIERTVYYRNGNTEEYKGDYSDNAKNGKGVTTFTDYNGEKWVEKGEFADDALKEGTKTYYDKKGKVSKEIEYFNGIEQPIR